MCGIEGLGRGKEMDAGGGEETMKGQDWGYLEETGEMRERERRQ